MKCLLSLMAITLLVISFGCSAGTSTGDADKSSGETAKQNSTTDSANEKGLNMAKFNKMEIGMSYEQIKGILGEEGKETYNDDLGGVKSINYEWKGEEDKNVMGNFRDDKLIGKSQSKLGAESGTADLSMEKFDKIQNDMPLEEVIKIIGSEGELMTTSKLDEYTASAYKWKGPEKESIFINFNNNKLTNKNQENLK